MKRLWIAICAALFAASPLIAQDPREEETSSIQSWDRVDIARFSEMLGFQLGSNLAGPGFVLDAEALIAGIRNGAAGKETPMTVQEYQDQLEALQAMAMEYQAADRLKEAESFLSTNRDREGVIELEPGKLQYQVVQKGSGSVVEAGSAPLVHYKGSYPDGSVFGSSKEGEPIAIALDSTIPGLARGVIGMQEGERRIVYIHPDLGFPEGPLARNSVTLFEIEVIKAESFEAAS